MSIAYTAICDLPVDGSGVVQNANGVSGGALNSRGFWINSNGNVATNTVRNGSAYINSYGFVQNPDGSIVVAAIAGGAYRNAAGFMVNPDGTWATATSGGALINSRGVLEKSDGSAITLV